MPSVYGGFIMDPKKCPKAVDVDFSKDELLYEYKKVDFVEKTGDGESDFVVKSKMIIVAQKDRVAYIDSFREDVGILNVLKKVSLTGDTSLLKQRPDAVFQDLTQLPNNSMDAYAVLDNALAAFNALPDELKGKMSFADFAKNFNQQQFDAYIASKQEKKEVPEDGQ